MGSKIKIINTSGVRTGGKNPQNNGINVSSQGTAIIIDSHSTPNALIKAGVAAGYDKQIQFNDYGVMGGSPGLTFDKDDGNFQFSLPYQSLTIKNSKSSAIIGGGYLYGGESIYICANNIDNSNGAFILNGLGVNITDSNHSNSVGTGFSSINGGYNVYGNIFGLNTIISGGFHVINNSLATGIFGGTYNSANQSRGFSIVGGAYNTSNYFVSNSTIFGGCDNSLTSEIEASTIIGGGNNLMSGTVINSVIAGGQCNEFSSSICNSSIIGGQSNLINYFVTESVIGAAENSSIKNYSCNSTILGGGEHNVYNSNSTNILGGENNTIYKSTNSSIVGGGNNELSNGYGTTILGGNNNLINDSFFSSILGGDFNISTSSEYSSIIGGSYNNQSNVKDSALIGGINNIIEVGANISAIIGGSGNTITSGATSAIIGGINLTLENEENTVLVQNLKVNSNTFVFLDLPNSDPGVAGQFWNSSGYLAISAGV